MSNNKQSSVEWLVEILGEYNEEMVFLYQNEIQQAKALHKQEITQAWKNGDGKYDEVAEKMSLDYYNEIVQE